jgi:cytochrome c oxidase assembly factor CtaG/putative copper export protein
VHLAATNTHIHSYTSGLQFFVVLVKDLQLLSEVILVGLLLSMAFFIREKKSKLGAEALRVRNLVSIAAAVWFMTTLGMIFLEIANLLDQPLVNAFDPVVVRSFLTQTSLGKTYLITLLCSLFILGILAIMKSTTGAIAGLIVVMIGLLAPIFQSHSAAAGNHALAIGSLLFHVAFISIWVGGVIGLLVISPKERANSIGRFSALALWSAVIVSLSGLVNAATRLNFLSAWSSFYALLVILKVLLTMVLIAFGAKHRKNIAAKITETRSVFYLLAGELMVMVMTIVIGGWLSTVAPPVPKGPENVSPILSLTGLPEQPQPTLWRLFWAYIPDGAFLGLLILLTALYIKGVRVLSKRGDKWPVGRTIAFAFGIAMSDYATSGGIGIYAHFAFSYHMVAHMILGMVAPIGFVLSSPITLALRTLPQGRDGEERGIRGVLIATMHSRYLQVISNPVVALSIFDGSLFILYMTPLFGHLMQSHAGHLFMNIHFLLAGALFFHVIIGTDPNPWKVPHIVRIIVLFAAMSIHAFFSIALLSTSSLVDGGYYSSLQIGWVGDLLADQHKGASFGWALGEVPILMALVATFIQWMREDKKETKRIDRAAERAAAMGEDDELAKYNQMLASLQRLDESEKN